MLCWTPANRAPHAATRPETPRTRAAGTAHTRTTHRATAEVSDLSTGRGNVHADGVHPRGYGCGKTSFLAVNRFRIVTRICRVQRFSPLAATPPHIRRGCARRGGGAKEAPVRLLTRKGSQLALAHVMTCACARASTGPKRVIAIQPRSRSRTSSRKRSKRAFESARKEL